MFLWFIWFLNVGVCLCAGCIWWRIVVWLRYWLDCSMRVVVWLLVWLGGIMLISIVLCLVVLIVIMLLCLSCSLRDWVCLMVRLRIFCGVVFWDINNLFIVWGWLKVLFWWSNFLCCFCLWLLLWLLFLFMFSCCCR